MATFPIEPLDITDINGIADWHTRFQQYLLTNEDITTKKIETPFYLSHVGKPAFKLLKNLAFPDDVTTLTVDALQKLLEDHLTPTNYEAAAREQFHNLTKKPDETYKSFTLRLTHQAAKCGFYGKELDTQMRDRLIAGVRDTELKRKLLKEKPPDFKQAKSIVQDWDAVNQALQEPSDANVMTTRKTFQKPKGFTSFQPVTGKPNWNKPRQRFQPNRRTANSGKCDSCGGNHMRFTCKFKTAECHSCHKIGHIAKVCRSKPTRQNQHVRTTEIDSKTEIDPSDSDADELQILSVKSDRHLYQKVTFDNGQTSDFVIDTGSPVNFMSKSELQRLQLNAKLQRTSSTITGVSGHKLPVVGQIQTCVTVDDRTTSIPILITKSGPNVLGLEGLRTLQIQLVLGNDIPAPLSQPIRNLIFECSQSKGGINIEPVSLEHVGDPKFSKARPLSYGLQGPVQQNLNDLVSEGILKPVNSSSWATPIVTPIKPNGQPRICGDYRVTVNKQLRQTATTTPPMDDMFQGLTGRFFTKIDLTHAFLQIPLTPEAKELTTINTPFGLFQYQYLPFGLNVSPGIFQREINKIIAGLEGTKAYQDDIIVFANSRAEHDKRLLLLLKNLKRYNVRINAQKSEFAVTRLRYLGYILENNGISPDTERIKAVSEAPKPDSAAKLQSLLGFAQFYARFVPNFANIVRPLYDLLREDFNWTPTANKAYEELITSLLTGKVLKPFQLGAPTELIVDASQYALGAILHQNDHPVLCISRKLTSAEQSYSQTLKEALAIHWSVQRLHKYLFGQKFTVVTDHQALAYIFGSDSSINKATSRMLQRWALDLSGYDFVIKHRPGKEILHADYLSRHSSFEEPPVTHNIAFSDNLPISRNTLIEETRSFYAPVIAALKHGWSNSAKKRFPTLHANRDNMHLTADGVIIFQDRPLIPPTLRQTFLEFLHSAHLGRDKTVSLSRFTCYWPSILKDIKTFIRSCKKCSRKTKTHNYCTPWPIPFQPQQRVHADYCGPFLDSYYALIIEDAYSKWPEVFLTKTMNAEFSKQVFQKFFAREGVPQILVTDNGTHFTANHLQTWLRKIGCTALQIAPRHPQSNGLAENFVKTLKTAIRMSSPNSLQDLNSCIDHFLLHYRNATHATTGKAPAQLYKGRMLRMNSLDTADIQFYRGNNNRITNGLIIGKIGTRMFHVLDLADGSVHKRHRDQITISSSHDHTSSDITPVPEQFVEAPKINTLTQTAVDPAPVPDTVSAPHGPSTSAATLPSPDASPKSPGSPAAEPPTFNLRRSDRVRKPPERLKYFLL